MSGTELWESDWDEQEREKESVRENESERAARGRRSEGGWDINFCSILAIIDSQFLSLPPSGAALGYDRYQSLLRHSRRPHL